MDKNVKIIIIRLFLVVCLFICSIPIWFNKSNELGLAINDNYENDSIKIDIDTFKSLLVVDDSKAFSVIEPTKVILTNLGNTSSSSLLFLVSKTSTVDYHDLRVSLDNTIYNLNDIEIREDEDNYYFILDRLVLDEKMVKSYDARIWINPSAGKLPNTTSLTTNFIILNN